MNDAYERRALLLHLGDVLEATASVANDGHDDRTLHELISGNASLARFTLLAQISPGMRAREFVQRATRAFASWPRELLELELNRTQLALTAQQALFANNPKGWSGYVAMLGAEVPWFGDGVPPAEAAVTGETGALDDETEPVAMDSDVEAVSEQEPSNAGDVERNSEADVPARREGVENIERIYPSWPWKADS